MKTTDKSNHAISVFKLSATVLLAMALTGCLGGGSNPTVSTLGAGAALAPTTAVSVTGTGGAAPTPAAVIAGAGTTPSAAAGTLTTTPAGATVGTQGPSGLSASAPIAFNNATNTAVIGAATIDPTFTLTPTGSIAGGTATGLAINTTNATTSGTSLSIQNGGLNTVSSSAGFANAALTTSTANSDQQILVLQAAGYSYTQFGRWYQCTANCDAGISTEVDGAFVRGEATLPANIPTTGTFTYTGVANGSGVDAAGNVGTTTAAMTANANFATRSIAFATTNTMITASAGGAAFAAPTANTTGTLTYAAGQNLFTGVVTTVGTGANAMTGTAAGRFNGPAAQEIGGVYQLSGAGGKATGVFIGK